MILFLRVTLRRNNVSSGGGGGRLVLVADVGIKMVRRHKKSPTKKAALRQLRLITRFNSNYIGNSQKGIFDYH